MTYDYLIIGQGLAGVSLAWHLHDMGKTIALIDIRDPAGSSRVAAGLYNPITGRKMTKTRMADRLFPYLQTFYAQKAKLLKQPFLEEKTIYRPFRSTEEQNEWMGRSADTAYGPYLERLSLEGSGDGYCDDAGGIWLKNCGVLHVAPFLDHSLRYFRQQHIPIKSINFDFRQLEITSNGIRYAGIRAGHIVFCRGVAEASDSLFSWLPFAPVKGELLEIESDLPLNVILNRGVFVIPLGNNRFRVGATYNNNDMTPVPTTEGRNYLMNKLSELIRAQYTIRRHYAGIRPATKDRMPFAGRHPAFERVSIFNGLGAKGVSLAPYFANQLANHLVDHAALDKSTAISRYDRFYGH